MLKTVAHILFCIVVITSLLAPPICNLLDVNEDAMAIMDAPEKEKKDKGEKDAEEKILQLSEFLAKSSLIVSKPDLSIYYQDRDCSYSVEIVLPPPEHTL